MPGRTSLFTDLVRRLQGEVETFREHAKPDVPFMQERVKPSEALRRLDAMTPGERQEAVNVMGKDTLLKMLRGGK